MIQFGLKTYELTAAVIEVLLCEHNLCAHVPSLSAAHGEMLFGTINCHTFTCDCSAHLSFPLMVQMDRMIQIMFVWVSIAPENCSKPFNKSVNSVWDG